MNVSERVTRVDGLISQTNSQIDRLSGLSLPLESAARPTASSKSSCLFNRQSDSSLDSRGHAPV